VKLLSMQLIPLSSAFLCQDCSVVGNSPHQCPACASGVLMGLANVLDRKQEKRSRNRTRATEFPTWRSQLQPVQFQRVA
jgi:hypothetical protein